jgi:hypothetical protein
MTARVVARRIDYIVEMVKEVCIQKVEPDGVRFDPDSVVAERIVEDADYEGVRVRFRGYLDTARVSMQLDIGFGDEVIPSPAVVEYPTIPQMPAPNIHGYSRESAVAEKFEAMVKLGILNSRMKDFYDIWLLSRQFDFDGETLASVCITNRARMRRAIDVTSYADVALAPADALPPAFSNLFVQTEIIRGQRATLCTRRPFSEGEQAPWLLHQTPACHLWACSATCQSGGATLNNSSWIKAIRLGKCMGNCTSMGRFYPFHGTPIYFSPLHKKPGYFVGHIAPSKPYRPAVGGSHQDIVII